MVKKKISQQEYTLSEFSQKGEQGNEVVSGVILALRKVFNWVQLQHVSTPSGINRKGKE